MALHPLAGQPVPAASLIHPDQLLKAYYERRPDLSDPQQLVSFGTSGHRGSAADGAFNEAHILAIAQAICEYRAGQGITGPLFLGKDSHLLSAPAEKTTLEVLAANGITTVVQQDDGLVPTPVISHAILTHNRGRTATSSAERAKTVASGLPLTGSGSGAGLADGIVISPSHNPPRDGGLKYNPPNGGPADTDATGWIQDRANALLRANNAGVKRVTFEAARKTATTQVRDLCAPYIADLGAVVDLDAIRSSGLKLGVDPLGGASVRCWQMIADQYGLNLTVVNKTVDPTFRFLTLDHDGQIRMDCSSPYAMANLVQLRHDYDVAFGNDTDADRHGIVTPSMGLLNPNHYLAVAIHYLFTHRPNWSKDAGVGKTLVSSSLINRVAHLLGRKLVEVPVGFKWFVPGLFSGELGFGGEESAGASFLRHDGTVWTTDKDGLILALLAAEITARTGKDPGQHYQQLTSQLGTPSYARIDQPASPEQKAVLKKLAPEAVKASTLAGEPIVARLTRAPGNDAPIGGLKVVAESGWFAARPSGTENIYKIYAESFRGADHLQQIINEAREIVTGALGHCAARGEG